MACPKVEELIGRRFRLNSGMSGDSYNPCAGLEPQGLSGEALIEYLWHSHDCGETVGVNWIERGDGRLFTFRAQNSRDVVRLSRDRHGNPQWKWDSWLMRVQVAERFAPDEVPSLDEVFERWSGGPSVLHVFFNRWSRYPKWSAKCVGAVGLVLAPRFA